MQNTVMRLLVNHFYKPTWPVGAVLYLTNACNLKCAFCEIGLSNAEKNVHVRKELTTDQLKKIVNAMIKMGVKNVYITGGEPFLAKNLWYLLDLCSRNDIVIDGITTNGSTLMNLSEDHVENMNKSGIRRLIISIDHSNPARHNDMRGKQGLFEEIEAFLKSDLSRRIKTRYSLSTVINSENYQDISSIIEWSAALGTISHINFQPVCSDSIFVDYDSKKSEKKTFTISKSHIDDLNTHIERALRRAHELNISTSLPFLKLWIGPYFQYANTSTFYFNNVMGGFVCSKPYNYLHVNYNGDLLACTHIGNMGNIDREDIVALWKDGAQKYKKILRNGKYFEQCKSCFCDFGANFRHSLVYRPIKNIDQIKRLLPYYFQRYRGKIF